MRVTDIRAYLMRAKGKNKERNRRWSVREQMRNSRKEISNITILRKVKTIVKGRKGIIKER